MSSKNHGFRGVRMGKTRKGIMALGVALLVILVSATQATAAVWYVKPGGTGDGTSWANAGGSIQTVVNACAADGGGEVWVAEGTHTSAVTPVVIMIAGVDLYGGFAGNETRRDDRDWTAHVTGIDGQNARYCVKGITGARIDGFTIQNGSGTNGGGMYNINASPTVVNCTFRNNKATVNGGAVYNDASSPLTVTNCTFTGNNATSSTTCSGGAIFTAATLSLRNCSFSSNYVRDTDHNDYVYGGAIRASAALSIDYCTFAGDATDSSYGRGGAIFCDNNGNAVLSVKNCIFSENGSVEGGGIWLNCNSASTITDSSFTQVNGQAVYAQTSVTISDCVFTGNESSTNGGAICAFSSPKLTNCTFIGNSASSSSTSYGYGGGVYSSGSANVTNCTFRRNTSNRGGGGIYASGYITGCSFVRNSAPAGGGLYYKNSSTGLTVKSTMFVENTAANGGGGMYSGSLAPSLINCFFALNSATTGGGLNNNSSTPTLRNCTFSMNAALDGGNGGAIFNAANSSVTVINSILWEDTGYAFSGNEIFDSAVVSTVTNSCIQNGWAGTGNIKVNPLFVNPADGDCRLTAQSACINAATIDGLATPDILGVVRGDAPDLGAYEYIGTPAASFGVSARTGAAPLAVQFIDRSYGGSGTITGWAWDFGDGTFSNEANPTHTYTAAGTYTVSLTVVGSAGTDTAVRQDYITVTTSTKTMPTISTWPTASSIRYGQTLASSTLSGGVANVEGTFAFSAPTTVPEAGTFVAPVTFTPTDTTNYNSRAWVVSVSVTKATPTVSTWPTAAAISYGQPLSASTLSNGVASVPGKFVFDTPAVAEPAGVYTKVVTFVPTDSTDYEVVSGTVEVTVNKATPAISAWPGASDLTYGQALSESTLSGGVHAVPGVFAFALPGTVPPAGTYSAQATFTPEDMDNYVVVWGSIPVTVHKATPVVSTWPTATDITYGQTLAASTLSGGAAEPGGSFAFTAPATVPSAGLYTASVAFIPGDTGNYNTVPGTVAVTVRKATPIVSGWPTIAAITYGQSLADAVLSGGTASVPGGFAFDAPGTKYDAGVHAAAVTFTPTDTANYNTVPNTLNVTVNKATPSISAWPTAAAITYGQTLADATLSGGAANVDGAFAYSAPSTAPGAGAYAAAVNFTPADTANHSVVAGTVTVTVNKATPAVSEWPAAGAITYGQALSDSVLAGGVASVPGAFRFDSPSTKPGAGTFMATVVFTPTDTANQNTVSHALAVTVNKATPTVSKWPTAAPIVYGQTLAEATLGGGTASVSGAFTYDTPSAKPGAGVFSMAVTFTPSDTANHNTVSGTVVVTVNKQNPVISQWPTAAGIAYGQQLSSATLSGGAASVLGAFAFAAPATVPNAGTYTATVVFTPSDTENYSVVSGTVSVSVAKVTPTVSPWPAASDITYGQALSASTLSGGTASVAGVFAFSTPATKPGAGSYAAAVVFTPTDSLNYNSISGTVPVNVRKAVPTVSKWPNASALTYGSTLAASTLSGGSASVSGVFAFSEPSQMPGAGAYTAAVNFNPADSTNYESVAGLVTVMVYKATPAISKWPTPVPITYGQTLADAVLSGGVASVEGVFAFNAPSTVPPVGSYSATVVFTATDTANYYTVSNTLTVTVNKATPAVSAWPAATGIVYGQTLASSTLSGGEASVAGSFVFAVPATKPDAGLYSAAVTFKPSDTGNYLSVSGAVAVTVNKATPTITSWPTAAPIIYGQSLSSASLVGGVASVAGVFSFDTPAAKPDAGAFAAAVSFTPSDTANYVTVAGTVSVTVLKATPTVSKWPNSSGLTYGQALSSATLSGGTASVPGSFAFLSPSTIPSAGTYAASVVFTPVDTDNYSTATSTVTVAVAKATPVVSAWPTAADITYGQALSVATLTGGTASVAGTFVYTSPATVPNAGTYTASVTFTPSNLSNNNPVTGTVSVTVKKATPTVSKWPTALAIVYGQALSAATLSGGTASVGGTFAYSAPLTVPPLGKYTATVIFTPTNTANYNTVTGTVSVTVNKPAPTVTAWPTATAITYGQSLAYSVLTGGAASVEGVFDFTLPFTVPSAGTYTAAVTFTPTDTANYGNAFGTVSVTVHKATPEVTAWPAAAAIEYGQTLSKSSLTGGTASVAGGFTFDAPNSMPDGGVQQVAVTFKPTDTANYNTVSGTVSIMVNPTAPTVSQWPTATAITYGQTLAEAALNGGAASVEGNFAFAAPDTAPSAGTYTAEVIFAPRDTVRYRSVSGTVQVAVRVSVPVVTAWPAAASITYGQALSRATLTGGSASVTGEFRFAVPTTKPNAGTYQAEVVFMPTDTANYESLSGTVVVTVTKAVPTVLSWPKSTSLTYGQVLASSVLNGGSANLNGVFVFEDVGVQPPAGSYKASVLFVPADPANYATVAGSVAVVVGKMKPTVEAWPAASGIAFGDSLSKSSFSGGVVTAAIERLQAASVVYTTAPVDGAFSFDQPTTVPALGTHMAAVTFRPADTANYSLVSGGSVPVVVGKGTPTVTRWPNASAITYGQTLAASTLNGGMASVAGTFAFSAPSTAPAAGAYTASVVFTPTDTAGYMTVSGTAQVTVNKATPTVSVWPTASAIAYGQKLSASVLTGGVTSVPGAFSFDVPSTVPPAGNYLAPVTFKPADAANQNSVSGRVSVMVGELYTVPDVAGMEQEAAKTVIVTAGFVVGTVTQANHPTVPVGSVISQSPVGGSQTVAGVAVNLTISKGPASTGGKPAIPANLRANAGATGVVLTWSPNAEPDLSGYNVYRGSSSGGAFTKVNTATVASTRYEDPVSVGQTYCYKITAITTGGVESDQTAAVCSDGTLVMWLQNISALPGGFVRIPLNITNARGIVPNGLDIDFRYDPALLDAASIEIERTAVTAAVNFTVNATEPGRVRISGVGDQQLVGEGHLFDITATMKTSALAGQCGENTYALVKFYDATPALMPCDYSDTGAMCTSAQCTQGDLNNDGEADSADVIIALQIAAGLVVPQGCQQDAGDLNGDGAIDSADAIMLQRLAVGLPLNPPQPGAKGAQGDAPSLKAVSRRQTTVGLVEGVPGGLVEVPVAISDATGVSGIELTASYPWTSGGITVENVQAGSLTTDFMKEINTGKGFVRLALSRAQALSTGSGTVAILRFAIPADAEPGTVLPIRLNAVGLKGQFGDSFSWYGDVLTVDGRITVKEGAYKVTVNPATGGTITLNPTQPDEGYAPRTTVTVTASALDGFVFANWTGALSGKVNPITLVVDGPKTIGAVFKAVETEGEGEGEVTPPASIEIAAEELAGLFSVADVDGSGGLSLTEAMSGLPGLTEEQFSVLDADGDGQVTRDELDEALSQSGCSCRKSGITLEGLKGRLSDLFLMGFSLMGLLVMRGRRA